MLGPAAEAGTFVAGVSVPGRGLIPPPEGYGPFPLVLGRSLPVAGHPELTPDMGCNTYENAADVEGKVVLVRDGGCSLYDKYSYVEEIAAGIVVFANEPVGAEDDSTLRSIDWAPDALVDIFGLYVTRYRGERLRAALLAGEAVTVTLRSEPTTTSEPAPGQANAGLALAAWPNPARGTATLRVVVDRPQTVRVEVFDVLGRRVALVHEGALAAGPHTLRADLASLRAGAYVVRATGDGGAVSRPLLLAR